MAEKLLVEYNWPGNIRELKNVDRARHHPRQRREPPAGEPAAGDRGQGSASDGADDRPSSCRRRGSTSRRWRELIRQALEITDWNQSKAAKKLNLGIDAFRYRMKKFGLLK